MNIGIAGTGKMGLAIGQRLLGLGHQVMVWNRNPARAEPLVAAGASRVEQPAQLAQRCDIVISLLTDAAAVEQVYAGPNGLLSNPQALLIEMSTVSPEFQARMAQSAAAAGARYLECPVSGSIGPAKEGKLIGFVGGDPKVVAQGRELLDQMCRKVVAVGAHGNGARMKLCVNLPLMVYWQTLGEALALVQELHIDPKELLDVLSESSGTPQATVTVDLATMRKDVATMVEQGMAKGHDMALTRITLNNLEQAISQGMGQADCTQFPIWLLKK